MASRKDEQGLVARANAGDTAALETLYRLHRDWVLGLALRFTGNSDDALDVLQDAFAYLFRRFPGFTLSCGLRGFLFPVVRNLAFSLLRRRRRVVDLDEERAQAEGKLIWRMEPRSELERMIRILPEEQQEVLLLRFAAGMRLDEIAEALSVPLGTVKSRLHNALKALRILQGRETLQTR